MAKRFGSEAGPFLDLWTGEFSQPEDLKMSSHNLQLIRVLTADFYRPIKRGALFSKLFPDEHLISIRRRIEFTSSFGGPARGSKLTIFP